MHSELLLYLVCSKYPINSNSNSINSSNYCGYCDDNNDDDGHYKNDKTQPDRIITSTLGQIGSLEERVKHKLVSYAVVLSRQANFRR